MSALPNRRAALRMIAAGALLPTLGSRLLAAEPGVSEFAPPECEMLYSRLLERSLSGGHMIRVKRTYAIGFRQQGQGYEVSGRQVGVDVDMPAPLAKLADMERQRVETALFPLKLDRTGRITGAPDYRSPAELDRTIDVVRQGLGEDGRDPRDSAVLATYLSQLSQASEAMASSLPADLFAPPTTPQLDERQIELPGGLTGTLRVSFAASRDAETGLMNEATREIVTAIEQERKVSRESWTLARA